LLSTLVVPLPSWPKAFAPQHQTCWLVSIAQVWSCPPATATAGGRPVTGTGTVESAMVPLPSWAVVFCPQHQTEWSGMTEHVWPPPPATMGSVTAAAGAAGAAMPVIVTAEDTSASAAAATTALARRRLRRGGCSLEWVAGMSLTPCSDGSMARR
jgi:hypothetical protein